MRLPLVGLFLLTFLLAYKADNLITESAVSPSEFDCEYCRTFFMVYDYAFAWINNHPLYLYLLTMAIDMYCTPMPTATNYTYPHIPECHKVVTQTDNIFAILEDVLRDDMAVCVSLHKCEYGNPFINRNFAAKRANIKGKALEDDPCEECKKWMIDLRKTVNDPSERATFTSFISKTVCKQLPKYQDECDLVFSEDVIPTFLDEVSTYLSDPEAACPGECPPPSGPSISKFASLVKGLKNLNSLK